MSKHSGQPPSHLTASVPKVFSSIKARGSHPSNLWFFDSPKNGKRFTFTSDVAFMHFVLLEGDFAVSGYLPEPPPVRTLIDGEIRETRLDAHIYLVDGHVDWFEFKREQDSGPSRKGRSRPQLSAQAQAAAEAGARYVVRTDKDLIGKDVLFDNWLTICANINRCKKFSIYLEAEAIAKIASSKSAFTFGELHRFPNIDTALMNAAIGTALQRGVISCDLNTEFLSPGTTFVRGPNGSR